MVAISRLSSSGENPCHPVVGSRCGYDSNGNRTNGNNSTPGSRDNRQSTDGTYNYSYDGEGNLTGRTAIATGDVRLFSYDYR
ncbi:MAG: hypothetical protein HY288_17590, partial [Planctomycetia bacterium]|nr:hypothetical protein [Planctomycetia bacterium]